MYVLYLPKIIELTHSKIFYLQMNKQIRIILVDLRDNTNVYMLVQIFAQNIFATELKYQKNNTIMSVLQ